MVRFAYLIVGFTLAFSATSAKLVDNLETSLSVLGVATEGLYTGQTTAKGLPHGDDDNCAQSLSMFRLFAHTSHNYIHRASSS